MFAFNIKAILNKQNLLFRGVSVLWSMSEGQRREGKGRVVAGVDPGAGLQSHLSKAWPNQVLNKV